MKKPDGNIDFKRASVYVPKAPKKDKEKEEESPEEEAKRNDKLVNVLYNEGTYYLY